MRWRSASDSLYATLVIEKNRFLIQGVVTLGFMKRRLKIPLFGMFAEANAFLLAIFPQGWKTAPIGS